MPARNDTLYASFRTPPSGYGEVAFYWWLGDRLTRERLTWQLDQLADAHVSGLQVNYAHSDQGGLSWGLTYPSEPALFSKEWWDLFDWFHAAAAERGIAVSLSDYTLGGPGQGWFLDDVIQAYPEMSGSKLIKAQWDLGPGEHVAEVLREDLLCLRAYRLVHGEIDPTSELRIEDTVGADRRCAWSPTEGLWRVTAIYQQRVAASLDPMAPFAGQRVCEAFFEKFAARYPDAAGRSLNFFFSDELNFGIGGLLWNDAFANAFKSQKGYDIIDELPALFVDVGPRTPKVRLDYYDVMVSVSEENYFRPVYEWHESRGMTYGCDHGGRGREVIEFGDYIRTQRWNQGPGCDQPRLDADVVKNKVASSISHLYERPRTWLEGFYASGWGTTSAQVVDATWRNFAMGHNLLTLHGLYYSTHGGWWEWAPPCNHFRMPYWNHLKRFLGGVERLSYLLSQGHHCCDVAVLYPVEPVQATGDQSRANVSFHCAVALYDNNIDLDFLDAQSLERADTSEGLLRVANAAYQALVLPAMNVMRHRSLQQAVAFANAGGRVYVVGEWPSASDRQGRDDPEVEALVNVLRQQATSLQTPKELPVELRSANVRDFEPLGASLKAYHLHRRIEGRDVYFVYGVPRGTRCFFRAKGRIEVWDAMTGDRRPWYQAEAVPGGTIVDYPADAHQPCVLMFSDEPATFVSGVQNIVEILSFDSKAKTATVVAASAGTCQLTVQHEGVSTPLTGSVTEVPPKQTIDGPWIFRLVPTMDNQWGDYRLPPTSGCIGAEVRRLRCAPGEVSDPARDSAFNDADWPVQTVGFGPTFWQTQAMSRQAADIAEVTFATLERPDAASGDGPATWSPYHMSWRFGVEDDPGRQGYHGLKGRVTDEFLVVGRRRAHDQSSPAMDYEVDADAPCHFFWTSFHLDRAGRVRLRHGGLTPVRTWLNGKPVSLNTPIDLPAGTHTLLLRYDDAGRNYVVVERIAADVESFVQTHPLAMSWFNNPHIIPFDAKPWQANQPVWYRCTLPPGFQSLRMHANGEVELWHDGLPIDSEIDASTQAIEMRLPRAQRETSTLAIRVTPKPGYHGGAAIAEPIQVHCEEGLMPLGDWSTIDALSCYSGGAIYRRDIDVPALHGPHRVVLDLGDVSASAEVYVNDKSVGVRLSPPWRFDITDAVTRGANAIEVRVFNTLANHYRTIPTRYRGDGRSGLMGPVTIRFERIVTLQSANS